MPNYEPQFQLLHVQPAIPPNLGKLQELAYNLRWSWHPETVDLFRRLDARLWESSGHNPVRMLGSVAQERLEWAAGDPVFLAHMDRVHDGLREIMARTAWFQRFHRDLGDLCIAYFSAEFGVAECLPIYSGGLGVLAGDHLKSASELGVPLVGVGLAYKQGYFTQYLNADGWQQEATVSNDFYNMPMERVPGPDGSPLLVGVPFPGREVKVQVWRVQVGRVPLYLLDTNVPENSPRDQGITAQLYGGDVETRIQHEILLGIGGMRALRAVGLCPDVCHINEGHAAFLALERVRQIMMDHDLNFDAARHVVSAGSVFTTHTPVPAGFDLFGPDLVRHYLKDYAEEMGTTVEQVLRLGRENPEDASQLFNMALFAVRNATFRNGVSRLHASVSRRMWEWEWRGYPENEVPLEWVTNGIHTRSWISPEIRALFNRYLGFGWSDNPADTAEWERVDQIPDEELWATHMTCKERLINFSRKRLEEQIRHRGGSTVEAVEARRVLSAGTLTIGFARRFASYKRATLLLSDPDRLKRLLTNPDRPVQLLFAGKAHPADNAGKDLIKRIIHYSQIPEVRDRIVFLENYDMNVGRHLVQGVDVWLNNPRRPLEASGTSGMKAAANGVLNLSVLDGWWDEGFDREVGWAVGRGETYDDPHVADDVEAKALYDLLERDVVPLYYERGPRGLPEAWVGMMKKAIRRLTPVFSSNRMVSEYTDRYYIPAARRTRDLLSGNRERVRELVRWSEFVRRHWGEVRVEKVEQDGRNHLKVGASVPVQVRVHLGALRPENVSVEIYHGQAGSDRQVAEGSVTELSPWREEGVSFWYEGVLPCRASGLYGYAVRVRPRHPDILVPHELNLITWF